MTLNNLSIFIDVYQTLSITQTAKNLYITQPAVSRAIKSLETEYDMRLFDRIGKKIFPTEEGVLFYKKAYRIISEINDLEHMGSDASQRQTIRIGAAIMIGTFLIPRITQAFESSHPNIEVKVTIASASTLTAMLYKNELDMALIEDEVFDTNFNYVPFHEDTMVAIVPAGHKLATGGPVTLSDLSAYPFLMREQNSSTRIYVNTILAAAGIHITPKWESTSTLAILNGVAAGIGVSIVPTEFAAAMVESSSIATITLDKPLPKRTCYIISHKDKYISEGMLSIMDYIRAHKWA